ncbi:MAG: phage baseplate assembly protein V [Coriobacteriaceae bacterium]|nr:phage baseplate assembly protein V [Coriobacteriaceae bacterium]
MADSNSVLEGLVRIGTVTDTDTSSRQARVKFQDVNMTSGWLPVVQHRGASITVSSVTSPSTGETHTHTATLGYWMPSVNDIVLVLYLPIWNADGFILGGI